jgi:hypothetical protein
MHTSENKIPAPFNKLETVKSRPPLLKLQTVIFKCGHTGCLVSFEVSRNASLQLTWPVKRFALAHRTPRVCHTHTHTQTHTRRMFLLLYPSVKHSVPQVYATLNYMCMYSVLHSLIELLVCVTLTLTLTHTHTHTQTHTRRMFLLLYPSVHVREIEREREREEMCA